MRARERERERERERDGERERERAGAREREAERQRERGIHAPANCGSRANSCTIAPRPMTYAHTHANKLINVREVHILGKISALASPSPSMWREGDLRALLLLLACLRESKPGPLAHHHSERRAQWAQQGTEKEIVSRQRSAGDAYICYFFLTLFFPFFSSLYLFGYYYC